MRAWCEVIVANEDHYVRAIKACFPVASQDTEQRATCLAEMNSVTGVLNEFHDYYSTNDAFFSRPNDWQPPSHWNCERIFDGETWFCPHLGVGHSVDIAASLPICWNAFKAEERIVDLLGNAKRASLLLKIKSLRVIAEEADQVVPPDLSAGGEDRRN